MKKLISLSRPDITKKEINEVLGVLKSSSLALGPKMREFEEMLARVSSVKYAVAVNSGTSALHLIIRALGITRGDEVITTPFSFIASANAALFEGAKPVFVDIKSDTLNIDPELVEGSITRRTKAILAVDVFGHPADWDAILRIAKRHNLYVIEDSAEAIGSTYKGKPCGSFGNAAILSFYPNKQITTGEGGALLTNDKRIAELALSMRNQGREIKIKTKNTKSFSHKSILNHTRLGYNYRISDIVCAVGVGQLKRLKEIIKKRKRVVRTYNEFFRNVQDIIVPYEEEWANVNPFVYVVRLADSYIKKDRDFVIEELKKHNIQASNYFPCIHLQDFYKKKFGYKEGDYPIAEHASAHTLALPFHNNLSQKEIAFVVKTLTYIVS